jgi:putative ABC transport system ATP-binding protein
MIVGPSGSGKTTLLNLIGTIDQPDAGSIEIDGRDITSMTDRTVSAFRAARIGFIFQAFNLMPVLSAYENIEYALLLAGLPAAERKRRTQEALQAVGLAEHQHHKPNQLSGGQRQRVAIARALVKRPALVLADEPTANLDSQTGASIVALMRDMQKQFKTTFIFSTHDHELMRHADQLLTMLDGAVTSSH